MGIQRRQVLVGMAKRGESVVAAASGDDSTENFGDGEGRRHGMEE